LPHIAAGFRYSGLRSDHSHGAALMEKKDGQEKSPGKKGIKHRTPFTKTDWIIAAISILMMIFILLNIPAY